jgi:hypothetical protein
VADAALLLAGSEFEWGRFTAEATHRHLAPQMAERLGVLTDLLPNVVPPAVIQRLRSDPVAG